MKSKFFTLVAIILGLIACESGSDEMNAQEPSWHLIAMDPSGAEVSSFSLKNSKPPVLDGNKVDVLNTWNNKTYSFDIDETLFTFDIRQEGSATRNESVVAEKLSVSYFGNKLRFSQPVKSVYIYDYSGALIDRPTGSGTDFNTSSLSPGNYIIATDKGTFKIHVTPNLSGGAEAQVQTRAGTVPGNVPIQTRAGASVYAGDVAPYYWNISDGTTSIPIDISQVAIFRFSEGTIIVEYKNGSNSMGMGYKSSDFATQPVQSTSQWDLEKTLKFGGASYTWRGSELIGKSIAFAIVHKNGGIAFHLEQSSPINAKFNKSEIDPQVWEYNGKLSVFGLNDIYDYGMTYFAEVGSFQVCKLIGVNGITSSVRRDSWDFNNNTNIIPTTITQNADGSVTMSCVDHQGKPVSYTFTDW